MSDIQNFGEVRATRCVEIMSRGLVVGHSNRDNDIKDIYLPPTMGYWPSYGRYLHEMGYMYTKDNNGGYIVKPRDGSDGSAQYKIQIMRFYRSAHFSVIGNKSTHM